MINSRGESQNKAPLILNIHEVRMQPATFLLFKDMEYSLLVFICSWIPH